MNWKRSWEPLGRELNYLLYARSFFLPLGDFAYVNMKRIFTVAATEGGWLVTTGRGSLADR